jgi:hypothetical protein
MRERARCSCVWVWRGLWTINRIISVQAWWDMESGKSEKKDRDRDLVFDAGYSCNEKM